MQKYIKLLIIITIFSAITAFVSSFLYQTNQVIQQDIELDGGDARIAIILDDVGSEILPVQRLLVSPYPLTFSIIPRSTYAHELSQDIWAANKEVMLHMPMEPLQYNLIKSYPLKLLKGMPAAQIKQHLQEALAEVQFVSGINNHMGSAFTQDKAMIDPLMEFIKSQDMFFIDSMTGPKSVGHKLAQQHNVSYAIRDVFLDGEPDKKYIRKQIIELQGVALKKGRAVGIAHIDRPNTVEVLLEMLPKIEANGFQLVFASQIVR